MGLVIVNSYLNKDIQKTISFLKIKYLYKNGINKTNRSNNYVPKK